MKSIAMSHRIIGLKISGLFGGKDYDFEFNQNPQVTILYGLNGTGKTTILTMIKDILNFNFNKINDLVFESLHFKLKNGYSIQYLKGKIKEESSINYISDRDKKLEEWRPFTKLKGGGKPRELRPNQIDLINFYRSLKNTSLFEDFIKIYEIPEDLGRYRIFDITGSYKLPYLRNISPLDLYDLLKPIFKDNKSPFPEWFYKFIVDNPISFIESERLIRFKKDKRKDKEIEIRVINTYSEHLLALKKNLIKKFNNTSQLLNSTFPKRVIDILKENSSDTFPNSIELKNKIDTIRQKEKDLISKGLLIEGYKEEPPIDIESLEKGNIAKVISLWIKDSNEKYSIFDELLDTINLLDKILNESHLDNKIIKFDKDVGFYFYSLNTKQMIKGDKLSSGEQHTVVLFYFLIFIARDNSFVLIDEPEISFHVIWQNRFIDHIIKIGKKKNLTFILATHSPEIIYGRINLVRRLESK